MAFANEFFILIDEDYSQAFEDQQILDTTVLDADTPEGPFAISGATNSTPIVITIGAHTLCVGRLVFIDGVLGNLAANGFWVISAVTGTTISIPVAGSGAYAGGGAAVVANSFEGHSITDGEAIPERDVLTVNGCVVPTPSTTKGRTNYAFIGT